MAMRYPHGMVGRRREWDQLAAFAVSGEPTPTLGIVWGRRRVGKSYLLETAASQLRGFYYAAVRGSSGEALRDLGARLAAFTGAVAPFAFADWDSAVAALLALGLEREVLVVLDEFPYLLEHTPALDSIIQRALGSRATARAAERTRLVLCGSAMSVMSKLLTGSAPLRGRAGLDLRIAPFDLSTARALHGIEDRSLAFRTFGVIGGVAAYAREMVAGDLPASAGSFDRWICQRVLSTAAPLFSEMDLLLSEDPTASKARKVNLYHAVLAGMASGNHTHQALTNYVKISGASISPVIDALVSTELIMKVEDPLRDNRPTYHPVDSLLRFHYAVTRKHRVRLAAHGADTRRIWAELVPTYESQVLGPCFEAAARSWTTHRASRATLGGNVMHVGPTVLTLRDGSEQQLDVVAAGDGDAPSQRLIYAIGEAKVGERISMAHVRRLEAARAALGRRADNSRLLCFGTKISAEVRTAAKTRGDLELVDLQRLYEGN